MTAATPSSLRSVSKADSESVPAGQNEQVGELLEQTRELRGMVGEVDRSWNPTQQRAHEAPQTRTAFWRWKEPG